MITRINPGKRMSEAVVYNGTIWLAGQVGEGSTVTEQTRDVLSQIDRLLAQAGSRKENILQAIIWLADIADFAMPTRHYLMPIPELKSVGGESFRRMHCIAIPSAKGFASHSSGIGLNFAVSPRRHQSSPLR